MVRNILFSLKNQTLRAIIDVNLKHLYQTLYELEICNDFIVIEKIQISFSLNCGKNVWYY